MLFGLTKWNILGLPVTYSIIFSGFFVKVYNYWCQILLKKSTKTLKYSSPLAQLSISFVFILLQIVITLFVKYQLHGSQPQLTLGTLHLDCNFVDSSRFILLQTQVLFPLSILLALFVSILVFALKTIDNLESRWILICTVVNALTWFIWLIFHTTCKCCDVILRITTY